MIPISALALAKQIGWRGGIIAALAVFCGIQTVRLNITDAHLDACRAAREADHDNMRAAQAEAHERAVEARNAAQQRYQELARKADAEIQQVRASMRDDGERFIAAHRLRGEAVASASSGTVAPAVDNGPGVPEAMPADAVLVGADDVRACTDLAAYALEARDWALSVEAMGRE